jgi:hypothetical protein
MFKFIFGIVLGAVVTMFISNAVSGGMVYIGPTMHTQDGGKFYCTFETKEVFYDFMQESNYAGD